MFETIHKKESICIHEIEWILIIIENIPNWQIYLSYIDFLINYYKENFKYILNNLILRITE